MNVRAYRLFLLLVVLAVLAWSAVRPKEYFTWFLEVLPVLIALPLLLAVYPRFKFTPLVYTLIAFHLVILMVGGHYTYAEVPAFNWLRDGLHLARNPYDRLGHFAQGFVPALVAREILLRKSPLPPGKLLFFLVLCVCMAISAWYELFEWGMTVATGSAADAFMGTQGDPWDAQWDMFMCLLGALSALVLLGRWQTNMVAEMEKAASGR